MEHFMEYVPIQESDEFDENKLVGQAACLSDDNCEQDQSKLETTKRKLFHDCSDDSVENDEGHYSGHKCKKSSICDAPLNISDNPIPSTSKTGCEKLNQDENERDNGNVCVCLSSWLDKSVNTDAEITGFDSNGICSNNILDGENNLLVANNQWFINSACTSNESLISFTLSTDAINDTTYTKEDLEENLSDPQDNEPSPREQGDGNNDRNNRNDRGQDNNDQQDSQHHKNRKIKFNFPNTKQFYYGCKRETIYFFSRNWVIWRVDRHRRSSWERCLREVTSFRTVDEFWDSYFRINFVKHPLARTEYLIFQRHVLPLWKYRKMRGGGHWIIKIDSCYTNYLDLYWLKIMLIASGQKFNAEERRLCKEIYGATICHDKNSYKISVYTKNASDCESVLSIGYKIKEVLNIDSRILYVTNSSAFCRSYRATVYMGSNVSQRI